MNERVRVNDLDRRSEERRVGVSPRGAIGGKKENPPKPLPAAEKRVANGVGNAGHLMIERRQLVPTDSLERLVDAASISVDFGDDARVECGSDAASTPISHESR